MKKIGRIVVLCVGMGVSTVASAGAQFSSSVESATGALLLLAQRNTSWVNDQTVVIGYGMGKHDFSGPDPLRSDPTFPDPIDKADTQQLYLEWYALGRLGIGYRGVELTSSQSTSVGGTAYTREVSASHRFVTVNFIVTKATLYARLGVLAGKGSLDYEYTQKSAGSTVTKSGTGNAELAGVFIDWGGSGFGARVGKNWISTDVSEVDLNSAGDGYYLDLRWAF